MKTQEAGEFNMNEHKVNTQTSVASEHKQYCLMGNNNRMLNKWGEIREVMMSRCA